MRINIKSKLSLSDTLISDIFILNNMSTLESEDVKVYIYILYLAKTGEEIESQSICKKLNITEEELSLCLDRLCSEELIMKNINGYTVIDLKENYINSNYTPLVANKKNKETT